MKGELKAQSLMCFSWAWTDRTIKVIVKALSYFRCMTVKTSCLFGSCLRTFLRIGLIPNWSKPKKIRLIQYRC